MTQGFKAFYLKSVIFAFLFILLASIVTLSLVPPVTKDALIHHLAVPKLYINHGGMVEILFMDFSYYPMNLDLLYIIPLLFNNDIAPKFIHFSFGLLTAFLIFYYLWKRTNALYALFGALFFLSIPIIVKLSITVYVDLGEIFFSFASLLLLFKWINNDFRWRFLLLSGIFCGLTLGTKYNGLVTLALLTLFIPFIYSRYQRGQKSHFIRPAAYVLGFLLAALLVFSPWMIRNYQWKNNPIYPLYNGFFNPPQKKAAPETGKKKAVRMNRGFFTYRSMIYKETGYQIALLPIRVFFQGKDGDPQYFDGKLNPFLLFLPFFAFFRLRDDMESLKREKKIMLAFSVLFFCIALFTSVLRIRYFAPIIPPLVILSVFGLRNLIIIFKKFRNRVIKNSGLLFVVLVIITMFSLNARYIAGQFKLVDPFSYISGKTGRDEYIARFIPEYPALMFINHNLDSDAKLLFVFLGKRGYYCDKDYIFNVGIMRNLIRKAEKPKDIVAGLRKRGITHLLVYYPILERWMNDNFSQEKQELTRNFFRTCTRLLFHENGYGVSVINSH